MKKSLLLVSLLALSSVSTTVFAGDFFVRGEYGRTDLEVEIPNVYSSHDKNPAYALRGGYWFNDNIGAEVSYNRLYDESTEEITAIGFGIVAKEHYSETRTGFFMQARAGFAHVDISTDFANFSDKQTKPYYGIGAGYDFNKQFGLSLNFDHNEAELDGWDINADTISLGFEARF